MQAALICTVALLIVLASGCSRQETAKTLARRLGEADRVTTTGTGILSTPSLLQTNMALTAEEAQRLIQAIATAKKEGPFITATPELLVSYFKGTNLLGEFKVGGSVFWIDHGPDPDQAGLRRVTPYADNTGTLEMLGQKFWNEAQSTPKIGK